MKILCPKCQDHPILDESLKCSFCGGYYTWKENTKSQSHKRSSNKNKLDKWKNKKITKPNKVKFNFVRKEDKK